MVSLWTADVCTADAPVSTGASGSGGTGGGGHAGGGAGGTGGTAPPAKGGGCDVATAPPGVASVVSLLLLGLALVVRRRARA